MSAGTALAWSPGRPAPPWPARDRWQLVMVLLMVAIPAGFVALNAEGGGPLLIAPVAHFYIVSAVSLAAAVVAGILAITTVQIGLYRVLFVCLGFMAMAAIFAVHGLTTPGIFVASYFPEYRGSAVGLSAYLSLSVPGALFAIGYAPGLAKLERRLPFWPAGWLVVLTIFGLVAYAGLALLRTELLAESWLAVPPATTALAIAGILLFFFSAVRQARFYSVARLRSQLDLIFAFVVLADSAAALVIFPVWSWGWWLYHLLMLLATCFAVRALIAERANGKSFRSTVETALQLGVDVDVEQIDVEAVAALAAAVEVKDRETQGHNHRVAELCVRIGHELGMPARELRVLARSGLLHDVGKLGIPDSILHKPGPLDENEWAVIKTHPEIGLTILHRAGQFKGELLAVLHHHERMDGSGYPHGLAGDAIPIEARVVAVADTYDVLISDRPYRKAMGRHEARRIVEQEAGSHLDRNVVRALMRSLDALAHGTNPAPVVELRKTYPPPAFAGKA